MSDFACARSGEDNNDLSTSARSAILAGPANKIMICSLVPGPACVPAPANKLMIWVFTLVQRELPEKRRVDVLNFQVLNGRQV